MVYQYRPATAQSDARLTDAFGVGTRYPYTMGLRCLLGHEYANREVEREREERGNEVVVTYRTVETPHHLAMAPRPTALARQSGSGSS